MPITSKNNAICALFSLAQSTGVSCLANQATALAWLSATTRADLRGDEWIINGQKVWNTSAHHADFGLLLARSDWDEPKHKGLSYFVLDMRQPGVEVQQLKQMNGHASFNEVFFY